MKCVQLSPIGILLFAAACSQAPVSNADEQDMPTEQVATQRFEQAHIDNAIAVIKAEPKVMDVVHEDNVLGVDWTVGVKDDGSSRFGYALYICQLLGEHSVLDEHTDVRVVDYSKFMASQGDARTASLGHASCNDESNLGV